MSANVRYLWDDSFLYVGVEVTDDAFAATKVDGECWADDGVQFIFDPVRNETNKPGKYDYAAAVTPKGPQAWCFLSGSAGAPTGEVNDIKFTGLRTANGAGGMTYEMAIPWSRLAPFRPGVGADLGICLVVNEDDGKGRKSLMTWFGDSQSKAVDTNGDLILQAAKGAK